MRRLIIISSSGLTLLFLVVLAWSVWTVVRAPFVMQTAGLPWAHERQQDEERKAKAAAEARRLPEERMRLAASDKAADEAEARRKVEEQQELAPPAVSPPSQGSPIGARGRNTDVPTSLAGAPLPPSLVFTPGPLPPSLVTPGPLPPSLVFTPGPLPPPSSLSM
jgi:hypothetical protein